MFYQVTYFKYPARRGRRFAHVYTIVHPLDDHMKFIVERRGNIHDLQIVRDVGINFDNVMPDLDKYLREDGFGNPTYQPTVVVKNWHELRDAIGCATYYKLGQKTLMKMFAVSSAETDNMLSGVSRPKHMRDPSENAGVEITFPESRLETMSKTQEPVETLSMKERREKTAQEIAYADNPDFGMF